LGELSAQAREMAWLVDKFAAEVPGIEHAVVLSSDGLLLTGSAGLHPDLAEKFAALASGVLSLAHGSARLFELGGCEQAVIRLERGFLFVSAISGGCALAVQAAKNCDMKVVGYQMALFADRAGHRLTPEVRGELRAVLTP
jgi:predicted regulator of Ras-like GTPase activity (Roadblock/LC7/MglB family)